MKTFKVIWQYDKGRGPLEDSAHFVTEKAAKSFKLELIKHEENLVGIPTIEISSI